MKDELWDIYDENRQLTGRTMKRNDWNMKAGDYHLTVLAVIEQVSGDASKAGGASETGNAPGTAGGPPRFLITRRVLTKSWAPGHWEVPGGGVMAGETSFEAVCREVFEETGLSVKDAEGKVALTYSRVNPDEGDNYFVDVYRFRLDFSEEDLTLQEEETAGYQIATLEEIKAIAGEKQFLHYDSIKAAFEE